jgi:polysaccharide export outer membrane protein
MLFRPKCLLSLLALASFRLVAADESSSSATANPSSAQRGDYILQPFDLVEVVVFQEPDLERKVRLSEESKLTLPLIGTVNLKGMTVHQAQDLIRDLYNKDYLVDPQINITVMEYAKETVNVLGSVNTPGSIQIPPEQPLNLLDAVTRAGGFNRLADRKHVKLTRVGDDGKTSTFIINVDDIIQSTAGGDQWVLQKGDVIFVGERIL